MQIQTVFRAGNSNVVAIPKSIGDSAGIKSGQKVIVEELPDGNGVVVRKMTKVSKKREGVNREFKKWLKEALEEDAEILDELANR